MNVEWSDLTGVTFEQGTRHADDRGSFTKLHGDDREALSARQLCMSVNDRRGTIRGLHVQVAPHHETKWIWCAEGAMWDVLVDLRPEEPTHGAWAAIELSSSEPRLLGVPPGVAHGYQTLTDGCLVMYLIDGVYRPESARTLIWNDATVAVEWPMAVTQISPADARGESWPIRF